MKKVLLVIMCMFILVSRVSARMISVEELKTEFLKPGENLLGNKEDYSVVIDYDTHEFKIYISNQLVTTFTFTDEYLEYINNKEANSENNQENFAVLLMFADLYEKVVNLAGYSEYDLRDDMPDDALNYETYGVSYETEHYEIVNQNYTASGDFIRHIKLSLDTSKIEKLFEDYGVREAEEVLVTKPSLSNVEKSSTSVSFTITGNPGKANSVYIYRALGKDGEYKKISEEPFNFTDKLNVIDEGLYSNSTYFYKVIFKDGTEFSDVIEVVTSAASSTETVTNPSTGSPTLLIIAVMVVGFGSIMVFSKRQVQEL